jgi:hypothetical protein
VKLVKFSQNDRNGEGVLAAVFANPVEQERPHHA